MTRVLLVLLAVSVAAPCSALGWRDLFGDWFSEGKGQAGTPERAAVAVDTPAPTFPDVQMGTGVYRVTGHGASPKDAITEAQGRLLAVGAAELDALRKLAAILEGTRLDIERESVNYHAQRYRVREDARTFLKGVRILETRYADDGTAQVDAELILERADATQDFSSLNGYCIRPYEMTAKREIEVSRAVDLPLTMPRPPLKRDDTHDAAPVIPSPAPADSSDADSATRATSEDSKPGELYVAHAPLSGTDKVDEITITPPEVPAGQGDRYSDLVLDARGLGVVPALEPKVLLHSGRQVFPVDDETLEEGGLDHGPELRYAKTLEEAANLPGFGGKPLVLEVAEVGGPAHTDIVLPRKSLRKLRPLADSRLMDGKGYIVILVD